MRKWMMFLTISFFFAMWFPIIAWGAIYANESENAYDEENNMERTSGTMEGYIIEGAGYFLQSKTEMTHLLKEVETGGELVKLKEIVSATIESMENAKSIYLRLIEKAQNTPYKWETIYKLRIFDYYGYQRRNGLNSVIFDRVIYYLYFGDVTGVYQEIYRRTGLIIERLKGIKNTLDSGKLPEIYLLWRLNQYYMESSFFGQYVAEVFYNL